MIVPEGYKLAIINPDGTLLDSLDLGGYDLSKTPARAEIAYNIEHEIERAERSKS